MECLPRTDDLKQLYNDIDLPHIDIVKKVMTRVENLDTQTHIIRHKKGYVIAVLIAVFVFCSGFTAIKLWELRGSNGSLTLRYQQFENGEKAIPTDKYADIYNSLKPGTAIAIYDKSRNGRVVVYSKPVQYTLISDIKAISSFSFMLPSSLPSGYSFKFGDICSKSDNSLDLLELSREAAKTGKDIVTKEVQLTDTTLSLKLVYSNGKSEINLTVSQLDGVNLYSNLSDKNIEKIMINEREGLYIEHGDDVEILLREEVKNSEHESIVLRNGKRVKEIQKTFISYNVWAKKSDGVSRSELTEIAQSLE